MITVTAMCPRSTLLAMLVAVLTACGERGEQSTAPVKVEAATAPYLNTSLDFDTRTADLVARMTLHEKIGQMVNQAPAIERLGIPEYNWWSEALHGVARAGLATVFPQAIGLAASWDEDLMHRVATAISDEARAKHHAFVARDKRFLYQGLTLWSPNINIFRDPRWGRGQETYGEDPLLTGRLAVQFITGLQGDDPRYLKTVATVKHFAVHSGPEPDRHHFDAVTDARELWDFYLPQFEMGIRDAGAFSLMCAYNRYNGEAACSSKQLLGDILRRDWAFPGFVVSDCGAIGDIHLHHRLTASPAESAARAVSAGTDLNCGTVYSALGDAVTLGLIGEAAIDTSVKRLFLARMKLGMFDPPEQVPYTAIPYSVVDSAAHRRLALEAAHKSIVLLKNEKQTLPLRKDLSRIAVIGPNADQWLMLLGNYNGVPADPVTPLRGIREAVSADTEVIYAQGSELVDGLPLLRTIPADVLFHDGHPGLAADYFANSKFDGEPVYHDVQPVVDVNWHDSAPRADMDDDDFSVRWRGTLVPTRSGRYQLGTISTCNTKLYLDGQLLADTQYHFRDEYGDPRERKSEWLELLAGQRYQLEVTAAETYADAMVQLVWSPPQTDLQQEALAAAASADAVVMFMGLSPRIEGEEMPVELDGFNRGDRTTLGLPKVQQDLIKAVQALDKPVVLVTLNGGALALNWEQENLPAILEAWYPGQAAGTAIADVLFGDVNPSGRLPVTYYRSVADLPDFNDYRISSQTYRYYDGTPLYPFGFGLSYAEFKYSGLQLPQQLTAGEPWELSFELKNISDRNGAEVVQVYVTAGELKSDVAIPKRPLRALRQFARIEMGAGETRQVTLPMPADAFSLVDDQGQRQLLPGSYTVNVGGGQPDPHFNVAGLQQTVRLDAAR